MSKTQKTQIYLSIAGISFIQGLQYCVSPVLGDISAHYPDVDISMVQMLITAPALLSMVVSLISGWLVVKISKKKLLVFASLFAGILGFLPFLADNFWLLFLCRTVFGISLGLATTLNAAVVADFFEGDERVTAMGFQAASVGAGMVVVTTIGGILGSGGFKGAYFINIIGFISMAILALCLPDLGKVKLEGKEKITLTKDVYKISGFAFLLFLFLITFTTNISMHLAGPLEGSSAAAGSLTGVFSTTQIIMGLVLGFIAKIFRKYTMPVAMFSFSIGAVILILFPGSYLMLAIGSIFCGFSQGVFIPTALVGVSNAVKASSVAMASAVFTCAMCLGQLFSPLLLNNLARAIFSEVTTTNVYIIAAIGMAISAILATIWKARSDE
jgi:predicted MFS family arabinose efflux permease